MRASRWLGQRRELACRVNGGIEVALYWSPLDNSTTVEVWPSRPSNTRSRTSRRRLTSLSSSPDE